VKREQILKKIDDNWVMIKNAYAGLSDAQMMEPGVAGQWSVRDILVHVGIWEEEALKHLPLIISGGTPPRYSVTYGGIDAFNALMMEQKNDIPLALVVSQFDETHRRLIDYVKSVPEEQFVRETRFRRRLKLDTYSHYQLHAQMIQDWRAQQDKGLA